MCWRCLLDELLRDLLSGPDGVVPAKLEPVIATVVAMKRPNSGVTWIRSRPSVRQLLKALGDGSVKLTHDALDELPEHKTVEYIRSLLVENGALPPRDRLLATYQRWMRTKLAAIDDDEQRRIIERFARWHTVRQLRAKTAVAPLEPGPFQRAKQDTTVAIQFLAWLADRGVTLAACTQRDIDAWVARGPSTRVHVQRFLYWCQSQRLTARLQIPTRSTDKNDVLGEPERLAILRSLILEDRLPLSYRVAASLIVLFGQPARRIVTMTIGDVKANAEQVHLRFGDDWIEIPDPFNTLMSDHVADRPNSRTAANADSNWLFPGRIPGQHLHPVTLVNALRRTGIPVRATRNATWQQLVREAPPQVLAKALGYGASTVMRHAERAGADWAHYASIRSSH